VAFESIQKNSDKTVCRSLVEVSLHDDRKDLLVFDGNEEFVLSDGNQTEKLRFRPLLAFSGSVRKLGATIMTAETATQLAERGDRAGLQYVATSKDGKVAFAKKLSVATAPGGIISKPVAMCTGVTAPWNVKNTSTQTVLFTYKIVPPLTVVNGPPAGSFTLAPGEARMVCNVTSETSGSYPMHFSQTPLKTATPASGDIDKLDEIDKLIWEGGPAKGPIVFDTATGREVVDDGTKELDLTGYTDDPLTVTRVNNVKTPVTPGKKIPLGGIGDKAPFIMGGLGTLVFAGTNLFEGTTVGGGKMETFFTAVPLDLPTEELDRVKTADGVVAVALETTDFGRELGFALLPEFDIYPSSGGAIRAEKKYSAGALQIVTGCPKVKSVTITFHPAAKGQVHTLELGEYGVSKSKPWTVTIPAHIIPPRPSNSGYFTVDIETKCAPFGPTKKTSETYQDDRPAPPPSAGGDGGGKPPSGTGAGGGGPKPDEKDPPEVITAGNTGSVKVGPTTGGTITGGAGGQGGTSGTASGGTGGTAPGGGGGSPQGGGATGQGGGSGAGTANTGVGNVGGTTGGGTTSSTGGAGTSQGGTGTGGQGGQGGQAPGGSATSGDTSGGQGGDASQGEASGAQGARTEIKPEVEIDKSKRVPATAEDVAVEKEKTKQKEEERKIEEQKTRQMELALEGKKIELQREQMRQQK
jgi:hypothetical protein